MNILQRVKNSVSSALRRWGTDYAYDTLPPDTLRAAATVPVINNALCDFSIQEYDRNPHYQLVVENLTNHTIGPHPKIICTSPKIEDRHNDLVEDGYINWMSSGHLGKHYREIRRQAAKTGIGIGIPYVDKNNNYSTVNTTYKIFGGNCLKSPADSSIYDRIINGIEYDSNWEPKKFYIVDEEYEFRHMGVDETKEYDVDSLIYFSKGYYKGLLWPLPECYAAFTFYPYVRRYLQAAIEKFEFNASFPMAIELDPKVYSTYAGKVRETSPMGEFEYQPRMIPTLKPGMSLQGIPTSGNGKDTQETMELFAATCALTVQMPRNLALANSNNSNMSSSQVDIQPWANKVNIDRFDMEPMFRKSFRDWWDIAKYREMPASVRNAYPNFFPHIYVYQDLFEHPDPNKRASARATDLASGATTLNRLYSSRGLNFRREMEREAKALRIPVEDLIRMRITSGSANALTALENNQELANAS